MRMLPESNANGSLCSSVTNVRGFCVVLREPVDLNKSIEDEVSFDKLFHKIN